MTSGFKYRVPYLVDIYKLNEVETSSTSVHYFLLWITIFLLQHISFF